MGVVGGASAVAGAVRSSRGRHPLGRRLAAVFPMLRDTLTGRWPDAPRLRVVGGLAGLVYLVSPVDLMPEILLGPFGLGDDIAIAAVAVAALLSSAEDWLDARENAGTFGPAPSDGGPQSDRPASADVIPGVVIDRG